MSIPHPLRRLARHPSSALPAVLLVGLAVGVTTGLFAYLGGLLWPRLDAPQPDRLVWLYVGTADDPRSPASYREYELAREAHAGLAPIAAFTPLGLSVGSGETTRFAWSYAVSAGYFELFGARPLIGRLLQPQDDRLGAPAVAVLHPGFWRARLGGDPGVVGRRLRLNGAAVTVVGVAPEGFQGHGHAAAVYFPLELADSLSGTARRADPASHWLQLLARLAPGWSEERVRAALAPVARAAAAEDTATGERQIAVVRADRYDDGFGADPQLDSARALFAGAVLFLLLAGASVTNLQLAHTATRQREWAIHAALGESRARMALRTTLESALTCAIGGALGVPIALALAARLDAFTQTNPGGLGGWGEWSQTVRLDARSGLFALAAAASCALVVSLASLPAVLGTPRGRALALRGAATAGAGLGGRRALVALQLALSLALCLGGGLLARSLERASRFDPGYPVANLHVATVFAPRNLDAEAPGRLHARLLEEVARIPGTQHPSLSHLAPLASWHRPAEAARSDRPDQLRRASYDLVSPGYFATLDLPIRAGRALDERDHATAAPAVVIADALSRELWGGAAAAVGRQLVSPGSPHDSWQVVGVVADVHAGSPGVPAPPLIYFPLAQRAHSRVNVLLRSTLPPTAVAAQVRSALRRVDPALAVVEITTGEEARRRLATPQRMHAELASLFAGLGLAVAMVGLFGLLSHTVVAGRRELAVRLAVGATPRDLLQLVARNALHVLGVGALLGVALWIPLARLIRGLLFGVEPLDPMTLAVAPALLAVVACVAAIAPALRAARTEPAAALRQD